MDLDLQDPLLPFRFFIAVFNFPLIRDFWWLWLFILLIFIARQLWLTYAQEYYRRSVKWSLLELRIPRELRKSPKAMEQVFTAIHALRNNYSNFKEHWWDGEITLWFSCEIVSFGGEIHFYMWVPSKHRNMVETALYSQYSDIEVAEAGEDYISRLPPTAEELERSGYKFFGNELRLEKQDAYPIRTYVEFEAIEEERQLDPIGATLETMARIKPQEILWLQILIRPTDESWKKSGEALVKELKEKAKSEFLSPTSGKVTFTERTPGEMDVMKAIERNVAKPGFETQIRYLYIAPPEIFDKNFGQRGLYSAMNQYASESLNRFKHNVKAWTKVSFWFWPHLFPGLRARARKERIYSYYRQRKMYADPASPFASKVQEMKAFHWGFIAQKLGKMVLNTEELATIFHPPTNIVLTGPLIKRIEAKKGGPPAGLPIYGEEGEELPGIK